MKVLYVGDQIVGLPKDGGDAVKKRNREMLLQICDEVKILEKPRVGLLRHGFNILFRKNYGHSTSFEKELLESIKNEHYDFVFFDGSDNGVYVKALESKGVRTLVFCHNVEYLYYKAKYKADKNIVNYILMRYIKYCERLAVQNAYKLLILNKRDEDNFSTLYNRKGDYKLPITFTSLKVMPQNTLVEDPYLLFVGSNFFSNNDGICWYITNVSQHVKIPLKVVGSCCDTVRKRIDLKNYPNVQLLGFVDDLDSMYRNAAGVVGPIFTGSGMKTKTIEALQYGKTIIGTSEAFVGVEGSLNKIGGLCNNANEFIEVINKMNMQTFNNYSMEIFNTYYSKDVVYPHFRSFLENNLKHEES